LPIDKEYTKIMVNFDEFKTTFDSNAHFLEDLIFVVEMNRPWKSNQHYPKGRIISSLGLKKDLWSQKRAILLQECPDLFEPVFNPKPESNSNVSLTDVKIENINLKSIPEGYKDFTKKCIFTIDPPSARDLDDAVAVEVLNENEFLVTVCVADVTRFIKEGDSNDLDAKSRSTSIYMIDSVEHMLDPKLSQNLASLHAGVNRYSLCVEWKMNKNGIINRDTIEFSKAIINSCAKLDYDTAQNVIESKETKEEPKIKNGFDWERVKKDILVLNQLAIALRKNRSNEGSLFLSNEEISFEVNEEGYPISFSKSTNNESHQLIEELMLVANLFAGEMIFKHYPDISILRSHMEPDKISWEKTMKNLISSYNRNVIKDEKKFDYEELFESEPTQKIMNKLFDETKNNELIFQAIQHCLLREMKLAQYSLAPVIIFINFFDCRPLCFAI
jgi:VacB/RNase II family 3'-5' exoribonuclease